MDPKPFKEQKLAAEALESTQGAKSKPENAELKMPMRIKRSRDGYFLSFKSQVDAEQFAIAFWEQADVVRSRPPDMAASRNFKSGMWKPNMTLTDGCRTEIMTPYSESLKVGGITAILFISGNVQPLQPYGLEALRRLIPTESLAGAEE